MKQLPLYIAVVAAATLSTSCSTMVDFYNMVAGQKEPAVVASADNIRRRPTSEVNEPVEASPAVPATPAAQATPPAPAAPASPATAIDTSSQSSLTSPLSAAEIEAAETLLGSWTIVEAGGKAVKETEDERHPYLAFDSTAVNPAILKVYAFTGCNTLNGAVIISRKEGITKMGEFATTMRLCPEALTETAIITAFNTMASYHLERHENTYLLSFLDAKGSTLMVAARTDMSFLDGAWQVTEIQPIKIEDDDLPEPMQLVFDINEGRLHGNTGCNILNATITTSETRPNSLTISHPLTTRMACPNAGLEQQLTNALSRVASAARGRHTSVYLLDEAGNKVITLHRISPEL